MADVLIQMAGTVAGAGLAAFVGVKVALARIEERATNAAAEAARAHRRIDGLLLAKRGMHG